MHENSASSNASDVNGNNKKSTEFPVGNVREPIAIPQEQVVAPGLPVLPPLPSIQQQPNGGVSATTHGRAQGGHPYPQPPKRGRRSSKNRAVKERKPRWGRRIAVVISALIVTAALVTGGLFGYQWSSERQEQYSGEFEILNSRIKEAQTAVNNYPNFEPEVRDELQKVLKEAKAVRERGVPGILTLDWDARTDKVKSLVAKLEEKTEAVVTVDGALADYQSTLGEVETAFDDAEELLKTSEGKTPDNESRTKLSEEINKTRSLLESKPDESWGEIEYRGASSDLRGQLYDLNAAIDGVEASVSERQDAQRRDPSRFAAISDRDWQLVQRAPESHIGEAYVIYGVITQADSITGEYVIRVNTAGELKSYSFEYDINTLVTADESGMFDSVVTQDTVKIYVEVTGSTSYETTIGGTATAVTVTAFGIELI